LRQAFPRKIRIRVSTAVLVSPSRGLLIFTPVFLFSIWGMIWSLKTRWRARLSGYLIAVVIAHWLLLGVYFRVWFGGHCYGPRLFTDLTPFFIFFLVPVLLQMRESASWRRVPSIVFMVLLCASVFIHSRGALTIQVYLWNVAPAPVDENRVWDWRDPQFLRGLRLPEWFKQIPDVREIVVVRPHTCRDGLPRRFPVLRPNRARSWISPRVCANFGFQA
jgi:hypothetical protein